MTAWSETGLGAVLSTIRTLAVNAFRSFVADEIHVEHFCASSGWVDDFMERAGLCLRILCPK
jgi:hypothetical protein